MLRLRSTYGICFLLMLLAGCSRDDTIVVGAKAFTEGYLLGHMAVMLLQDAGYDVEEQFGVATAAMRSALETGQVDLYFEYTGTAYANYAGGSDREVMIDSARVLEAVRSYDNQEHRLAWLRPLPFNNTYTLLMQQQRAEALGIRTFTDLAERLSEGEDLSIAVDAEFYERPDGLKKMLAHYGFPETDVRKFDAGLAYRAVVEGEIDVAMGYSTDGRIQAFGLTVLKDNRNFFPAYNPAAVVRMETLERHPGISEALRPLNEHLNTETIQRLNAEVDLDHRDPRKVVKEWLTEEGLLHGTLPGG